MMRLIVHAQSVAYVRLPPATPLPTWAQGSPVVSVTQTRTETSLICPTTVLPDDLPGPVKVPLVPVVIDGVLGFSKIGVLVSLLKPLADVGIPVLNLSTFDTDWVFIDANNIRPAVAVWRAAGFDVVEADPLSDAAPTERREGRNHAAADEADDRNTTTEARHDAIDDS